MKKRLLIVLVMIMLFVVGCGKSELNHIDLDKSVSDIDNKMSGMYDADVIELKDIYGVDVSLFDEYVFKVNEASNGDIYAIIKVSDANRDTVKKQMTSYFSILEEQIEMYSPDVVSKIKNRLETNIGDYLIYISSTDNQGVYDVIKGNTD